MNLRSRNHNSSESTYMVIILSKVFEDQLLIKLKGAEPPISSHVDHLS
jgi:hypothetical protein